MINKFKTYRKFKEYISHDFENIFGYIGAIIITLVSLVVQMSDNFHLYVDIVNSFIGGVIGAFIGALALVLTGIIFWGSLLNEEYVKVICSASKDENAVDKLYISYLFLAFNIICYVVLSICGLLFINSTLPRVCDVVFYFLEFLAVYFFLFNIGYMVSIMRNCIQLIHSRNIYIRQDKKTMYERANELRIDIIYELLYRRMSSEEMHDNLLNILNNRIDLLEIDADEKQKLKKYLEEYYKLEV